MRPDDDEGLTLPALLDVLEEQPPDAPLSRAGESMAAVTATAAPGVGRAAREVATATAVAVLLVLVPVAALIVVTAETTAKVVTGADLAARSRSVASRVPGWAEEVQARSQRAAQWVLGPQGIWTGRGPRRPRLGGPPL